MYARKLIGFAALALAAVVVTGFALNAIFSAPAASAIGQQPHGAGDQTCVVGDSTVVGDVCSSSGGGYEGGSWSSGRNEGGPSHVEATTCNAGGVFAVNQCDVGGDANAFTVDSAKKGEPKKDGGDKKDGRDHKDCGCDDKKDGRDHKDCGCDDKKDGRDHKDDCGCDDKKDHPDDHRDHKGDGRDKPDAGIEATTCNAGGLVAVNQCGVDGNANAFTITGLLTPVRALLGGI
jgi:hypothetical protein